MVHQAACIHRKHATVVSITACRALQLTQVACVHVDSAQRTFGVYDLGHGCTSSFLAWMSASPVRGCRFWRGQGLDHWVNDSVSPPEK